MQFYAHWDNISTNVAWGRPSLHGLMLWWYDIRNLHNLDDCDVYLVGGFAEYLHNPTLPLTWDMDICFVSDNMEYSKMKKILDDSYNIMFKHNILVDAKVVPTYMWEFFQKLHSGQIPKKIDLDFDKFHLFINWKKYEKYVNGELETSYDIESETNYIYEVYPGLYKLSKYLDKLYEKVTDRFNEGIYKGKIVNLKTTDFNFVS